MPYYGGGGGGSLGATVEVSELEALAKGSLIVGDGSGAPREFLIGADGLIVVADSTQAAGVRWGSADSGALQVANNLSDVANAATSRTNLSLGNVTNTSDANKPVSTAQQAALDLKANLNSPTLVTPVIGVATATSVNKVAVTAPATSATLTIADGATLTASASATVSGTNTGDQTNISGNAATVTTNANLTGHVTSVGNAAVLGSFTLLQLNTALSDADVATGGGTATGTNTGDQTNISGNAATVTTNANLTGPVTSVGNATTIASGVVTEAMQVLADNITQDVSITKHGYAPKAPNDTTQFLNGAGAWAVPAGGVTGFTPSQNTSVPNNTVNASRLLVSATSTNADFVLQPKGTGAILGQLPDSTATGGNKRGANAVDLQTIRATNLQVASAYASVVGGGRNNRATGAHGTTAGGDTCTNSGMWGTISGGGNHNCSGTAAVISGGINNTNAGTYSVIPGGYRGTTRGLIGVMSRSCGRFGTDGDGDAQTGQYILRCETTDATATVLTSNQSAAGTTNQVILPNNSNYTFYGKVSSHRTDAIGTGAGWVFQGSIRRGANAASTTILTAVTATQVGVDAGAATWTLTALADTTNGGLKITFTGEAAKTIRSVCVIDVVEVTS